MSILGIGSSDETTCDEVGHDWHVGHKWTAVPHGDSATVLCYQVKRCRHCDKEKAWRHGELDLEVDSETLEIEEVDP